MNCIQPHYEKSSVPYEHSIEPLGGVGSLLFYLKKGVENQRKEEEAWLTRKAKREG